MAREPVAGETAAGAPPKIAASGSDEQAGGDSLYRPEALLAYRQGGRATDRSRWLDPDRDRSDASRPWFYGLLGLALATMLATILIPIDDRVLGEAVVRLEQSSGESNGGAAGVYVQVYVLVPDARRGQLALGQALRLELESFPGERVEARVSAIADGIILPENSHRVLGEAGQMPNASAPPLALVQARLEPRAFTTDGRPVVLRDGMRGRAEVLVASTSLLVYLVPALRTPQEAPS